MAPLVTASLNAVPERPPLQGSAFSGFFDEGLRQDYIDAGEMAASKAFDERGSG